MGTHPIFESDFDCLTEHARVVATTGNDVATHHSSPTSHCPAVAYHDGTVASLSRLFRLSTGGGSLGAEEALVQWSQRRFPATKVASQRYRRWHGQVLGGAETNTNLSTGTRPKDRLTTRWTKFWERIWWEFA